MKFIPWFYALLLKGYPASFQEAFGEEMREAFLDALDAQQERRAWMRLFLHELADWPGALLREHWVEMQRRRKEFLMTEMVSSLAGAGNAPGNGAFSQTGSWRDSWRAGFPHGMLLCLAALGMVLQNFTILEEESGVGNVLLIGVIILFWGTLIGTVGRSLWVAYKAHWPSWAASWYGYVFVLLAVPVLGMLQNSEIATRGGWDQVMFAGVLPLLLIGWLYALVRKDRVKTLLLAAPFAILLWMPGGEFVPTPIRNPVNLWMLAILMGVAVAVMRVGWQKGLWWAAGGSLLVGLPAAYARSFHAVGPNGQPIFSTLADMLNLLFTTWFWSVSLILGPLMLGVLREAGQRLGGKGRRGAQLLLVGLAVNLLGNLFLLQTQLARYAMQAWQLPLSWMALVGLAGMVIGAVVFVRAAVFAEGVSPHTSWLAWLVLGFPITWMFPILYTQNSLLYFSPLPVGFLVHYPVPEWIVYGVGMVWLLLAGWFSAYGGTRPDK